MEPIKIGSTVPAEKIHNIIEKFSFRKSLNINYEEYNDRFEYTFTLNKKKTDGDIGVYSSLANFSYDIIMDFYSKKIISIRINKFLSNIEGVEKSRVIDEVYNILIDRKQLTDEKEEFKNDLLDYLIENNTLIIDGYLTFRPKSFNDLIDKAIEKTLDKIYLIIEYNEYIDTLQFFVDTQYSQAELVNILITKDGIQLLDAYNNPINNHDISNLLEEIFQEDISEADVILSSLLALAPQSIVIHGEGYEDTEIIIVLKEIFRNKIHNCKGCDLCTTNSIEIKNTES
ncbi:MAG: sporulation protein YtxC [Tissierellaceae bacterium]|nr:sporulation protein YtxC [Tissierellaceae bacterium]